jgi:cation diffusion facilitator CzcD-associated flavoprotein CzcO
MVADSTTQRRDVLANPSDGRVEEYDAIVIGAGVAGIYQLYRLRAQGLSVRLFEEAEGVGGVWYWNRYPGALLDSESYTYQYSFSKELLEEWKWSDLYAGQPELERYVNYVADKFDLRKDIQFGTRVDSVVFNESDKKWDISTTNGIRARAQFVFACVGLLSAHVEANFAGLQDYAGEAYYTARWPHEEVSFAGKRVAVVGTASSGVQVITEVAKTAAELVVFQRTPQYSTPLRNRPLTAEDQEEIQRDLPEILRRCAETFAAFQYEPDPRSALDVSEDQRREFYETIYQEPGFKKWLGNFDDIMSDQAANDTFTEFIRDKMRERIQDPKLAEKLIPTDYPFGGKRPPMDSGYYEVFNQPNVTLVDVREDPISHFTETAIVTAEHAYDVDMVIFATGFDFLSGPLYSLGIKGVGGQAFQDAWSEGPQHYLGVAIHGFPNFFMINGGAFCNVPRCLEFCIDWTSDLLGYMRENGYETVEPTAEAVDAWMKHSYKFLETSIFASVDSYFWGANIPGKPRAWYSLYPGGAKELKRLLGESASKGYEGFELH